jgi:hypothetical protein
MACLCFVVDGCMGQLYSCGEDNYLAEILWPVTSFKFDVNVRGDWADIFVLLAVAERQRQGAYRRLYGFGGFDRIKVDSVDFGYYARSAAEPQKYLQPVYVFRGTAYSTLPNGKQTAVPYEQYCLALEKPLESIWPETKQFKSEPRREGEIPPRGKDVDEPGGSS